MFFKTYKISNVFEYSRKISVSLLFLSLLHLSNSSTLLAQTTCDSSQFCKNLYNIIQDQRKIDLDKILSTVQIPKGLTEEEFQQTTLDYLNAQVMNHITHRFGYGLSSAEKELNFANPTEANIKSMLFSITSSIETPQAFTNSLVNQLSSGFEYKTTGFGYTYNPIKMSVKELRKFLFDIYSDLETDAVECADTKDNDRDGLYDFEDPSCYKNLFCEDPLVTNGVDCIIKDLTSIRFRTMDAAIRYRLLKSAFGSQKIENGKIRDSQVNFESILQEFWFNHFNVDYQKVIEGAAMGSGGYERTIHEKIASTFFELLQSVITHPAMLQYLDNQSNIFMLGNLVASNQNLGRELMELHTLGIGPDLSWQGKKLYTQDDVEASSLILTGINIFNGLNKENEYEYGTVINPLSAAPDSVFQKTGNTSTEIDTAPVVMGNKFCLLSGKVLLSGNDVDPKQRCAKPSSAVDLSRAVKNRLSNYLRFLANHSRTKENICRKLSSILVAPSFETYPDGSRTEVALKAVSENCIQAWGADGDLKAIYKAILQSPEVWNKTNYSRFTKNPLDLVISAVRTMGITAKDLRNPEEIKVFGDRLNADITNVGLPYRTWMTPTGYNQTAGWLNQSYLVRWTESAFKILNHFEQQTAVKVILNTNGSKVTERYAPIMGLHPRTGYKGSLEEQCNKLSKHPKRPGYEKCQYVYKVLGYGNVRRNVFRIEELIRKALDDRKLVGRQWIPGDDRKKPREIVPVKTGTLLNTTSLEFMKK